MSRQHRESELNETYVQAFWNEHACGDTIVGGLHGVLRDDDELFFSAYCSWRYRQEPHILDCLDRTDWRGRHVLEIGLGQGDFVARDPYRRYVQAPPLPGHGLPGERLLGSHLWVTLEVRRDRRGTPSGRELEEVGQR